MSTDKRFDESVSSWLQETAPARLPERVLEDAFERTRKSKQQAWWRALLGRFGAPRLVGALGSAAVLVLAAALALNFYVNRPGISSVPSPSPAETQSSAPQPSVDLGIFEPVAGRIVYGNDAGIWGVDPDNPEANRVQLTSNPGNPLTWSRDGTRLLIEREGQLVILHSDGSETQVTEQSLDVYDAAMSPDGSRVVFIGGAGGDRSQLFTVDADGGVAQPLAVRDDTVFEAVAFSPDGARIAYVHGAGDNGHRVWVVDSDGSNSHEVLANDATMGAGHLRERGFEWSPVGDRMALAIEDVIYTFAADGSDFKLVAHGEAPYWSPDGSRIAYTMALGPLAIADADGTHARPYPFTESGPWNPVAMANPVAPTATRSPDLPISASVARVGREVLRYADDPLGTGDLIAVNPETGETRILVHDLPTLASASWSSDGNWIGYKDWGGGLSVVGPNGVPRRVTTVFTGSNAERVHWGWGWSTDGTWLTYRDADGQFLYDAETALMQEGDFGPVFSPDGTKSLGGVSGGAIHSVDVRTFEDSLLVQLPGENLESCCEIKWSPDGSRVAIGSDLNPGEARLFVMDEDGSGIRVVANDTALSGFEWSPDGTKIAFAEASDVDVRIWVANTDGTAPNVIGSQPDHDEGGNPDGGDPVWSPDGSQIAFWTEPGTAFVVRADGTGGVSPIEALTYEDWRGGWYECSACLLSTRF